MIFFKYTYYRESRLANAIECSALLLVVLGAAIGILNAQKIGFMPALLIVAMFFAAHFGVKKIAAKVNNYMIEKRIAADPSYAKYIAVTYPDMQLRCSFLNSEYAENGDNIPFVDFHPKRERNTLIIQIVGLTILLLITAAAFGALFYLDNL